MTASKRAAGKIVLVFGLLNVIAATASQEQSARDVLKRFCDLDARGGQLTPTGWRELAGLFTAATSPRVSKIIVMRDDFVVSVPAVTGDRAEFYVEYIALGEINTSSARFSALPPVMVRAGFDLALTRSSSASVPSESTATAKWLIEGTPPEPHLTAEAAIRYWSSSRAVQRTLSSDATPRQLLRP
jgi:hypothetical protein